MFAVPFRADFPTLNGRIYPANILQKAVDEFNKRPLKLVYKSESLTLPNVVATVQHVSFNGGVMTAQCTAINKQIFVDGVGFQFYPIILQEGNVDFSRNAVAHGIISRGKLKILNFILRPPIYSPSQHNTQHCRMLDL